MNDYEDKLTWRDVLAYLLVYSLWIVISAAAAYALMLLRSAFPVPLTVLLARNPYFHTHTVELRGMVNSFDRLLLIVLAVVWIVFILWVEEYFRASIVKSRERRPVHASPRTALRSSKPACSAGASICSRAASQSLWPSRPARWSSTCALRGSHC